MASWTKKLSSDTRYSITLTVTETSTSVADNTSVVSYTLTATKSGGSGYYTSNKTNPVKVTLGGTEVVNKKVTYDFTGSTPKTITLASGTQTITHDADGTKTISCSGYFKDAENSLGNATASGNLTLTPLHKPPEPSINSITETNSVLTGYGITGNKFVAYLSKKQFGISSIKYDGVSITNYTIKNGTNTLTASGEPSTITLDFKNKALALENNKVKIELTAIDSMNSIGSTSIEYENPILYFPATIVASSFKSQTRRAGQLTGNITLSANGTYYNGSVGSQAVSPKVYYRYKEKTASTFNSWTQIADGSVSKNNGNWSTSITLSGFNYQKAYDIEVKVSDNVAEANSLNVATASTTIPVGEPTWTEYKDRVDFKKLTINKQQILAPYVLYNDSATSGNITLSDSVANYQYIEVFYLFSDNSTRMCQKVYSPSGNTFQITGNNDNGTYLYISTATYSASGTTLTATGQTRWRIATSGNATRTANTTNLQVFRVVGYK